MKEYENDINFLPAAIAAVTEGEEDLTANLANAAALVFELVPALNWAGFYILKGDTLVLGPFQGKVACTRIKVGRGVCGTAVSQRAPQVVEAVCDFPGHISCDAASVSEMVVPLYKGGEIFGVLDLDSPVRGRFNEIAELILKVAREVEKFL